MIEHLDCERAPLHETFLQLLLFCLQDLSQEKKRRLEQLGVREQEEKEAEAAEGQSSELTCREPEDQEELGDLDLLQDLRHIEEQMRVLLKEKEQAEEK